MCAQRDSIADMPTYQWRKRVPTPERDKESKPREEENAAVHVDRVQKRDRMGLVGDGIDLWGLEGQLQINNHCSRGTILPVK